MVIGRCGCLDLVTEGGREREREVRVAVVSVMMRTVLLRVLLRG